MSDSNKKITSSNQYIFIVCLYLIIISIMIYQTEIIKSFILMIMMGIYQIHIFLVIYDNKKVPVNNIIVGNSSTSWSTNPNE